MMPRWLMLLAVAFFLPVEACRADELSLPPTLRKVAFEQRLGAQLPLDVAFKDESGRDVMVGDYCRRGKPIILVFGYFRCPMLCTEVANGLVRAMLDLELTVGADYDVITISFDPRDTPDMAAAKKKTYLERYGRQGAEAGWHFLTGSKEAIERVTGAAGFRFVYDAKYDQFAHASGLIVLTPQGKIARYFYDIHFRPRDLRLGLVEASGNQIGSPVDQVLLFCFHYDPTEGRYGVAVMNLVRLGGVLTLAGIGLLVFWLRRGDHRQARLAASKLQV